MIRATFPSSAIAAAVAEPASRTIRGIAVPYGVPGVVASGETVVFDPGSLDPGSRPIALRDHDRGRVIGRVVDADDQGAQMGATVQASRTPLGDEALTLAADGLLMFSVGADPTEFHYDDRGVLRVQAATWNELSLLSFGAYQDARVLEVTATEGDPPMPQPLATTATITPTPPPTPSPPLEQLPLVAVDDPTTPPVDPDDPEDPDDDDPDGVETVSSLVTAAAGHPAPRPTPRQPAGSDMTISRMAAILAGAYNGTINAGQARRVIRGALEQSSRVTAALTNVTLVGTNNVGALQRPAYQAELVELINWGRPAIEAIRQGTLERGDYPAKTYNTWELAPKVALQTNEKDPIFSAPVKITPASAAVLTWAGGNDISQQILDFGSPSFVEDYIRAAAVDFATKSDTYAVTQLLAAAIDVPPGTSFIEDIGLMLGALVPTQVPPGPLFMLTAWDQAVGLVGVPQPEGPALWSGTIDLSSYMPSQNVGGLRITVDPNMPAGTKLLGMKNAATWYQQAGTPASLRVNDVALLGLDVAVYGYGALGVQYPGALAKMTAVVGP